MSRGARAGAPVRRARVSLRPLAHRTPRARVFRHGPTVPTRTASRSPRRRRAPRAAEDKRPGVAAEDHQQSESPRQGELRSGDLGSASPVVDAEEGKSPGIPDPSAAAPASSCQLEDEEKEAHDYFSVFLNGTERVSADFVSKALPALPAGCCRVCCLGAGSGRAAGGAELLPSSPCSCWPRLCPLTRPVCLSPTARKRPRS
ncbi:uncharacterized protein J5F26_016355 [Ciconia maguari]